MTQPGATPATETMDDAEIVIKRALTGLEKLRFDKANFKHQTVVGLQLSIVEQAHSALILLQNKKVFDAKIILRSTLEHYVELANCTSDESYYLTVQENFVWNVKKTLSEAQSGNPFFARIAAEIPVEDELAEWEQKTSEIKDLGGRRKNTAQKFSDAGLDNEYQSVYRSLSNLVHPSFSGLIERQMEVHKETNGFQIVSFKEPPAESVGVVCHTICSLINESLRMTALYLKM